MTQTRRGYYTLANHADDMVRLVCDGCGRRGQYRKDTLLAKYPADTPLPELRHLIAQCERWQPLTGGCAGCTTTSGPAASPAPILARLADDGRARLVVALHPIQLNPDR
jgi:hypothetical protein